jgi:uncharacterized phiE125 gp8 family phage protein
MRVSLRVITPPAVEPVSLADAQQVYLHTDEDVSALITAAREYCEGYQNKKYITQTLELVLDRFPCGREIEFHDCSPIQSVTSIKYTDSEGTEHTMPDSDYIVDPDSFVARVVLGYNKSWPTVTLKPVGGVVIRFVAGYGDTGAVPETVKQAMGLHMQWLHDSLTPDQAARIAKARDALLGMRRMVPV